MPEPAERLSVRIALREEGEYLNAYFAQQGTMDGAVHMGAIRLAALHQDETLYPLFAELMKQVLSGHLKRLGINADEWHEERAPEHERSGNA